MRNVNQSRSGAWKAAQDAYCTTMASLIISTIVFFIASFLIGRWADSMDFPKSMMRSASVFVLALALSYAVAALVDWIV